MAIDSPPAVTQTQPAAHRTKAVEGLVPAQIFDLADNAIKAGDVATAIAAYKALAQDADIQIRSEARFRHAMLLARMGNRRDAAILYRHILDEQPDAVRVRLELARLLAEMGDEPGEARELRAARSGKLPPDVTLLVDQFANALRSRQALGGSVEISLAPDSNINRATRKDTLDTVIAPISLSDDARAKSGIGLAVAGQVYGRRPLDEIWDLRATLSGNGRFYRTKAFNDQAIALSIGLQSRGKLRVAPSLTRSVRWFGGHSYATTDTASVNLQAPLSAISQMNASLSAARNDFRLNKLQDGASYEAELGYERALSPRSGVAIGLSAQRQTAADPGYALAAGGGSLLGWYQLGRTSFYIQANGRRLIADKRLLLFPDKRREWFWSVTGGATMRQWSFAGFAPILRLGYERNMSTVGLYDYSRVTLNAGLTRAF